MSHHPLLTPHQVVSRVGIRPFIVIDYLRRGRLRGMDAGTGLACAEKHLGSFIQAHLRSGDITIILSAEDDNSASPLYKGQICLPRFMEYLLPILITVRRRPPKDLRLAQSEAAFTSPEVSDGTTRERGEAPGDFRRRLGARCCVQQMADNDVQGRRR